eukprot:CAMPEP_0185303414 /NCGR_PEP_ID=MMETSP1363-20130426/14083_1 /TAXON_ID=38817 /ORGANISM="Gephyrocapsa oceanica, Strain RCC1303" /LENGTH=74 /DNA_ID=CAMNT_0027900557 /DNA_START=1 /DNA_END=221 /DNA_ORIENTATION=+
MRAPCARASGLDAKYQIRTPLPPALEAAAHLYLWYLKVPAPAPVFPRCSEYTTRCRIPTLNCPGKLQYTDPATG